MAHASQCEIDGGQSVTATVLSPSTSVFPGQYHSTITPYPFIYLSPNLLSLAADSVSGGAVG
jgi:hypothetical protein